MNFLAAIFLFFVEEQLAFWLLHSTISLLPKDFYSGNLKGVKIEVEIFRIILAQKLPKLAKHCSALQVDVGPFVTQWFLCLFINQLPIEITMRFLDCFFYDGNVMLFRVTLALFVINQNVLLQTFDNTELLLRCKHLPENISDAQLLFGIAYNQAKVSSSRLPDYRKQAIINVENRQRLKLQKV